MKSLTVSFGDPDAGWMFLTVQGGEQTVEVYVSDVYPSLSMLVQMLRSLMTIEDEMVVTWTCEPAEYDMIFTRNGAIVTLNILAFPDSRRSAFVIDRVLTASGRYEGICLPFWRALRSLEGRFTAQELAERWTYGFPHQQLSALTKALGKQPGTPTA